MKKLLVLALVLSMATMASAALQISVDGVQDVTEVTVAAGVPTTTIGIWTDAAIANLTGTYYALGVAAADGSIDLLSGLAVGISSGNASADSGLSILAEVDVAQIWAINVSGLTAIGGGAFAMDGTGAFAANANLFSSFSVTANASTTLYLLSSPDAETNWTTVDSVNLVVPEPMTLGLLGLGGLFLRRRK